jgi:hypothetical protein
MSLEKRIIHLEQFISPHNRKSVRFVETEAEITDDPDVLVWFVGIPEGWFQQGNDDTERGDTECLSKDE